MQMILVIYFFAIILGVVVVVIAWQLDLPLPVPSLPITTIVVSSNSFHDEVYSIQHYVIKSVSDLRQVSGFLHNITEILLKVALNTISQIKPLLGVRSPSQVTNNILV